MQELRGKYVNVVLTVQEGRGMDALKHNVFIVANFNGRIMESDPCEPKSCPSFSTELVWESEKKDLRKVRSVNSPLRVECYSLDEYQKKECIGFALLSLRSAPIIPPKNPEVEIPFKWYKLLGVPGEYRSTHPELFLSLTIRDHMSNKELPPAIPFPPELSSSSSNFLDKEVIPIRFLQDGFIQIGDENVAKISFNLTITVKSACNLHLLLPENLVFQKTMNKYYLTFVIFGLSLKSKPFYKDLHEPIQLNEKVCIKILSQYEILKTFFEQYYDAVVCFFNGNDKLGVTNIKMKQLVIQKDFSEKISFQEDCYFLTPFQVGEIEDYEEVEDKAFVTIECNLELSKEDLSAQGTEDGSGDVSKENFSGEVETVMGQKNNSEDIFIEEGYTEDCNDNENHFNCNISFNDNNFQTGNLKANNAKAANLKVNNLKPGSLKGNNLNPNQNTRYFITDNFDTDNCGPDNLDTSSSSSNSQNTSTINSNVSTPKMSGSLPQTPRSDRQKEESPSHGEGYGDQLGDSKLEKMLAPQRASDKVKSMATFMPKIDETEEFSSRSTPILKSFKYKHPTKIGEQEDDGDILEVFSENSIENYKQFSFFIMIESIIWKKKIHCNTFTVKFFHPKANNVLEIKTDVENLTLHRTHILDNVHCKLFFVAQASQVRDIIQLHLPKIVFEDFNGNRLFEDVFLSAKEFLENNVNEITTVSELKSVPDGEVRGEVTISMFLEEIGMCLKERPSDTNLMPQILDDSIITTSLEDLQKWKDDQMADYLTHLKLLEKIHISKLSKDWNKRKLELEEKLINSVEKCKKLSRELQKTKASLHVEKALETKRKALHAHAEINFNEDLYKNMVKFCHCDNIELLTKITEIRLENEELRKVIKDQKLEMEMSKKNSLTNEQTTNLLQELKALQEKYEQVQKAKSYFKDEWKKAIKEIHELKSICQKHLQDQIQINKEELSQFKMDRFYDGTKFTDVPNEWSSSSGYNNYNFNMKGPNTHLGGNILDR